MQISTEQIGVPWRSTKIVCTLGPSTDDAEVLAGIVAAGMNVARINASHGNHREHARRIQEVREAAQRVGRHVAVLLDLPGPKFRLGRLRNGLLNLNRGAQVTLAVEVADETTIPVADKRLLEYLQPSESVYLADGAVELRVLRTAPGAARCEVVTGGTVRSGSGVNLPESSLPALVPTVEDRRHIKFAVTRRVDWIGVSFVQSAGDLVRVRELLPRTLSPLLMAKIEKRQAVADLAAIIEAADGIMVARGDLGVETDLAGIALLQKSIIAAANKVGRPVITATQMLESMIEQERPTRAEVTDVTNAMLDGTDGVMLSAETAVGRFPVAAVKILQRVLVAAEAEQASRNAARQLQPIGPDFSHDQLSFVACQLAFGLRAKAIVAPVSDIETALAVARFRPSCPILTITKSEQLCRSLAAVWGVSPMLVPATAESPSWGTLARQWLVPRGLAKAGDALVTLSLSEAGSGKSDSLQVVLV